MAWIAHAGADLPPESAEYAVSTSKQSTSTIVFCKSGADTVRQVETETVTEFRALDEASAKAKAGVADETSQSNYYAAIGGENHSITVVTGTKTEVSARRANEAGGWTVVVRKVDYSVDGLDEDVWKTTRVVSGGNAGAIVSISMSSSHVRTYSDVSLYATKTTTVTEHTGLSQADAQAMLSACAGESTAVERTMVCTVQGVSSGTWVTVSRCWTTLHVGNSVYASARNVSNEEGYTVTKTVEAYGWSQSGAVNNSTTKKSWSVSA